MSRFSAWRATSGSVEDATPSGINVATGAVAIVVAACVAAAVPTVDGGWRWSILASVVGGFAGLTVDLPAVAAVIGLAWLVGDGFLVNRAGELSWHGWADLDRLLALATVGALGLLAGSVARMASERRERDRFDAGVRRMVFTVNDEEKQRA